MIVEREVRWDGRWYRRTIYESNATGHKPISQRSQRESNRYKTIVAQKRDEISSMYRGATIAINNNRSRVHDTAFAFIDSHFQSNFRSIQHRRNRVL